MSPTRWAALAIIILAAALAVIMIPLVPSCAADGPPKAKGDGAPKNDDKPEIPKDGMIYVWPLPNQGHQSLVVLNVIDGNVIDAAYLVPVRIRLRGVTAPGGDEKGGKEARAAVDRLLGGQLRAAQLWGVGKDGVLADFWIAPEKDGEKGQWASAALIKGGSHKESK